MSSPPPSNTSSMDIINNMIKTNVVPLCIAIYLIVIIYYTTKDPDKLFTKTYLYASMIIIPLFISIVYILSKASANLSVDVFDYMKYSGIIIVFILLIYLFNTLVLSSQIVYLATAFIQLIIFLMVIVALAIIYKVGYNILYKIEGWPGFIINLIFYIPCMVLDLLEYIKNDFKQAPKAVYVLLIIELILGLLYIYIPKFMNVVSKSLSNKDGKVVLMEPLSINKLSKLSSYVDLQQSKITDKTQIINNKFAISAWVYVVSLEPTHSPYNTDATIFEFSDYHPRVIYNGAKGKFKAFFNRSKSIEFDMPLQKWNHVVFNYTKSNADLFINGELKGSALRDPDNENLTIGDVITVGQTDGLSGGICNLVYFSHPLIAYEIKTMYAINKDKDPPINL
jgi:hypothetical protein